MLHPPSSGAEEAAPVPHHLPPVHVRHRDKGVLAHHDVRSLRSLRGGRCWLSEG